MRMRYMENVSRKPFTLMSRSYMRCNKMRCFGAMREPIPSIIMPLFGGMRVPGKYL